MWFNTANISNTIIKELQRVSGILFPMRNSEELTEMTLLVEHPSFIQIETTQENDKCCK
jgi:hypothetical protein